LKLNTNFR